MDGSDSDIEIFIGRVSATKMKRILSKQAKITSLEQNSLSKSLPIIKFEDTSNRSENFMEKLRHAINDDTENSFESNLIQDSLGNFYDGEFRVEESIVESSQNLKVTSDEMEKTSQSSEYLTCNETIHSNQTEAFIEKVSEVLNNSGLISSTSSKSNLAELQNDSFLSQDENSYSLIPLSDSDESQPDVSSKLVNLENDTDDYGSSIISNDDSVDLDTTLDRMQRVFADDSSDRREFAQFLTPKPEIQAVEFSNRVTNSAPSNVPRQKSKQEIFKTPTSRLPVKVTNKLKPPTAVLQPTRSKNYQNIVSPVGLYIKMSPFSPLMRKTPQVLRWWECFRGTITESDSSNTKSKKTYDIPKSLPEVNYVPAKQITEKHERCVILPNSIRLLVIEPQITKHLRREKENILKETNTSAVLLRNEFSQFSTDENNVSVVAYTKGFKML